MKKGLVFKTSYLFLGLFLFAVTAFAQELAATPSPIVHYSVVPVGDNEMPLERQKAVQPVIDQINAMGIFLQDNTDQHTWNLQEPDGREASAGITYGKDKKIRECHIQLLWKRGGLVEDFLYDGKGRLRKAEFVEDWEGKPFGIGRTQDIYLDEKGKILEVHYFGQITDVDGKVRWSEKNFKNPVPLSDGSQPSLIFDPQRILAGDILAPLADKKGFDEGPFPYVGLEFGGPPGCDIIAGTPLWAAYGLNLAGMYWGSNDYDLHAELALRLPSFSEMGHLSTEFDILGLYGFGSDATSANHSYSGVGMAYRLGGMRMELDCVQDRFFNFPNNDWRVYWRLGLLNIFD